MNHHDIALVENPNLPKPPENWEMFDMPVAINHIAITMPNREAWLKQLAAAPERRQVPPPGQPRHDPQPLHHAPNGYGVEVLYELPREVLGREHPGRPRLRRAGADRGRGSLCRRHDYPKFGKATAPAAEVMITSLAHKAMAGECEE